MKGVILAGGTGSRLLPLTKVTNKSLLPIYNKPMIYYPILTLKEAGITDLLLVCGGNHVGAFSELLGNGDELGVKLSYAYQKEPRGIADALSYAETFANTESICVILGDNILQNSIRQHVKDFNGCGARIFVKQVAKPEAYGVVEFDEWGMVCSIEEKPAKPRTSFVAIGLYMYDFDVFNKIRRLTPSARGELEVTDLNKLYMEHKDTYGLQAIQMEGWWGDCGENHDTYLDVQNTVRNLGL